MQIKKLIFIAAFCLFAFILLFVNREFSVADNGDFTRYMTFIEKTANASVNWPASGTVEHHQRFFSRPHIYWDYSLHHYSDNWKSSMVYVWEICGFLNRYLFSEKIVNIRSLGLPLFLLQFLAMFLLFLYFKNEKNIYLQGASILAFIVFCDSVFVAFFNSLYPQGCAFATISILFTCCLSMAYSERMDRNMAAFCFGLCLISMIFTAAAKQQYVYFLLLVLCFSCSMFLPLKKFFGLKSRSFFLVCVLGFGAFAIFFGERFFPTEFKLEHNIWDKEEISTYKFHAHFLYEGVLPRVSKPQDALKRLGLPKESVHFIGKSAYDPGFHESLIWNKKVTTMMVLKTFCFYPSAVASLLLQNIRSFGKISGYALVPETDCGQSPLLTRLASSFSNACSGYVLLSFDLFIGLLLIFVNFGGSMRTVYFNRILASCLLSVIIFDLLSSMGDGDLDTAKHILSASYAGLMLMVQFVFFIVWYFSSKPHRHLYIGILGKHQQSPTRMPC